MTRGVPKNNKKEEPVVAVAEPIKVTSKDRIPSNWRFTPLLDNSYECVNIETNSVFIGSIEEFNKTFLRS